MGNAGWGWDDVLPYFRLSEDYHAGASDAHGALGELRVERQRLSWPILDAFQDAAEELGIPRVDDFNTGDNHGSGYFEVNQRNGVRWNSSKSFLRPALHRKNLTVLTGAEVAYLNLAGDRVSGISFRHRGVDIEAAAVREVILSAGAINSPKLLELSGIGRPDVLEPLGMRVRHQLDGVGENLQDHLQIRTVFEVVGAKTLNRLYHSIPGRAAMALEYALSRSGPLSMAPSQLGIFARSGPEISTPNLEYHVQPLSTDRPGETLHKFDSVTVSVCNLRPESRGTVHMASSDGRHAPKIRPNYLSAPGDRTIASDSIRHARALMATNAVAKYQPREFLPGTEFHSSDDLTRKAGDIATTIFHPVGTCRMGEDSMAVVDATLKVRGLEGLRVVDASIMPTIVSGNTHAPVVMIAEKAAGFILGDHGAASVTRAS